MVEEHNFGLRTRLIHGRLGVRDSERAKYSSHVMPIWQTSTWKAKTVKEMRAMFSGKTRKDFYTRVSNPNSRKLEYLFCLLEEGEAAQVFNTGMAAIEVTVRNLTKMKDQIIAHRGLYGGTINFLKDMALFGISTTFVDARDFRNVLEAVTKFTRAVLLESPSNPMMDICDYERVKSELRKMGREDILVVVDNTFATPHNQRPLNNGADIVIHSATKYLNGYGNFMGGAVVTSRAIMERIWKRYSGSGAMDAEVAARMTNNIIGIGDRMERHNKNGFAVATYLASCPWVSHVYYCGFPSHTNHDVAKRLMTGFGGMVSFELAHPYKSKTETFIDKLAQDEREGKGIVSHCVSLGIIDTTICCPGQSTHLSVSEEEKLEQGINNDIVRLSVGTEDGPDIIYSLKRGSEAIR